MIKEIKQFFIRTWEKVKQGGRWVKKHWKGLIVSVFGATAMAVTMLPKDTTPSVEVNGVVIEFPYTDDNTDENVLIYTDKETYSNGEYIYMAIKNEGVDGSANIQFFFEGNTEITEIKRLVKNSPYQVDVPEYKTVKYDCSKTIPAIAADSERYIEQTCERDEQTGSHSEIRYKDVWLDESITDFSKEDNDLLVKKIKEKPKKEYKTDKKIAVELVDSFTYFRAKIKAPMRIDEEFFIEVIGDELYGHLDPFLSGWDLRIQFDVSSANIDAALTHFPLLLTLSTSTGTNSADVSAVFDEVGANSKKIAVTTSDETTQIYAEIEKWATSTEQAWIWVSATGTVISNSATTTFYLYYDNDHADNTTYIGTPGATTSQSVWDSNFRGVWHLGETGDGTAQEYKDSTSNNNDGQGGAGDGAKTPTLRAFQMGDGQDFESSASQYINIPDSNSLDIAASLTLETWVWIDTNSAVMDFIGKDRYPNELLIINDEIEFIIEGGACDGSLYYYDTSATNLVASTTYYFAAVYATTPSLVVYVDSASQAGGATGSQTTVCVTAVDMRIGSRANDTSFVKGIMDEVRVSATNRSASWVKATYHSGNNNLISWGSEEIPTVPSVTVPEIIMFD